MKLPIFFGVDPRGWLMRAKTYFQIHRTPKQHKVLLTHICMEGDVVHWFSIVRELNHNLSWKEFKSELLNRFGGITNLNPYEQLAVLQQMSSVDYIYQFETIASMIPREPETMYLGYFMNGLQGEKKLGPSASTSNSSRRFQYCKTS